MKFILKDNNLCVINNSEIVIENITAKIQVAGNHYNVIDINSTVWKIEENGTVCYSSALGFGDFKLKLSTICNQVVIKPSFLNKNKVINSALHIFVTGYLPYKVNACVSNGFAYYKGNRMYEMQSSAETEVFCINKEKQGSEYVFCSTDDDSFVVIGAATYYNYFTSISISQNGKFSFVQDLDGKNIEADQLIDCDLLTVVKENEFQKCMKGFTDIIAEKMGVRAEKPIPNGWCSWYYYGPNISEKIILDNAKIIKEKNIPIKLIQIDDGWSNNKGDWQASELFPSGMKQVAKQINQLGYTAGIWVAPFKADKDSSIYINHKDWFVHDYEGNVESDPCLDFSHPEVKKYLHDLFYRLSHEWGYRYIKIDLITSVLSTQVYYDKSFNAIKNYREAFKIITEAVTEDTFLLACTSPMGASIGLCDGIRVSADIFERWESLKDLARQVIKRYYLRDLLITDADCLLLRTSNKQDDECFRLCIRDENEIKTFITLMSASGGALMFSDKMELLNESDFLNMKRLFPLNQQIAVPLDLFESDIPQVLEYGKRKNMHMYAVFNWEDRVQNIKINHLKKCHIKTYWSNEYLGFNDNISLKLQPHSAEILYFADSESDFSYNRISIMP